MTKFSEVKGVKGLKKLMKEIAVTASTGKHDNEFIGEVMIPLNVSLLFKSYISSFKILTFDILRRCRHRVWSCGTI